MWGVRPPCDEVGLRGRRQRRGCDRQTTRQGWREGVWSEAGVVGRGASETPEQTEQRDKAMLALIKLYQYPQLMVSGPVQLQDAQVHQPKGAVAWQDSQAAAQPEQQQEATRAVHARH